MNRNAVRLVAAALLFLSIAGRSRRYATPFYENVDAATLPGAPIELQNASPTNFTEMPDDTFQVTFSGDAYNSSMTQAYDVLYLPQFNFALSSGDAFDFTSGTWSAAGDTLQVNSPSGFLPMSDTDAPLTFTRGSAVAMLTASDSVPYISVGTIDPGKSASFSFVVDMANSSPFELDGSFVAPTGVPEPSTLALAAIGVIAICFVALRRTRKAALLW